jgi:hypothetical protein
MTEGIPTERRIGTLRFRARSVHKLWRLAMCIARLAQLAERKALNLVVVGSSPTSGGHVFCHFLGDFFLQTKNCMQSIESGQAADHILAVA